MLSKVEIEEITLEYIEDIDFVMFYLLILTFYYTNKISLLKRLTVLKHGLSFIQTKWIL